MLLYDSTYKTIPEIDKKWSKWQVGLNSGTQIDVCSNEMFGTENRLS